MNSTALTAFLVPIAVGLSFALFRRLCPVRVADGEEPSLSDEERRIYRRWEVGALLPIFVFGALLTCAWYLLLREVADLSVRPTRSTFYLVRPVPPFWLLPALFLGIVSVAFPMEWLYRSLLGNRYRRYERFCNERTGFDGKRAFRWLSILAVAGSAVGFLAGVTSFARFDKEGVEIGRVFALRSVFYEYGRVRSIEHRATFRAPSGATVRRPHYVISFDDGTSWSTHGVCNDPVPERDDRIAQLGTP